MLIDCAGSGGKKQGSLVRKENKETDKRVTVDKSMESDHDYYAQDTVRFCLNNARL